MREQYWSDGMMGLVVGDALGLPVQFEEREYMATREQGPVTGMEGFGAFLYPEGTWSDDSSLALATLCSINEKETIDSEDIMSRFLEWYRGGYTPFGVSFDQGATCLEAILNYGKGTDATHCGKTGEYANGNGALMRILPVCLWCYEQQKKGNLTKEEVVDRIHGVASLTHNHLRSNMACGLYYFMSKAILDKNEDQCIQECLQSGIDQGLTFYGKNLANLTQMAYYGRLFHLDEFKETSEDEISFSGYVVDTLEAAVWSLLNTNSFKECLLKVVNYGDDSDTVGAVAGGLAGLYYGYGSIPGDWTQAIQRREWVQNVIDGNAVNDCDKDKKEEKIVLDSPLRG